jgi:hypothetical protein
MPAGNCKNIQNGKNGQRWEDNRWAVKVNLSLMD